MLPPVSYFRYAAKAWLYAPITFVKRVVFGRDPYWRQWFWSRWGCVPVVPDGSAGSAGPVLWVEAHGGEITQVPTIGRLLREECPWLRIAVSTNNRYSFDFATRRLNVDLVFDTPWDLPGPMRRALSRIRPSAIVFIENVKYPVLVKLAARRNIPTLLLSGFISKNWTDHPTIRRCIDMGAYRFLTAVGARSEEDARLFQQLGVLDERPVVTGNLKFDPETLRLTGAERAVMLEALGWQAGDQVFVAGGIRADEYEAVTAAFHSAARTSPHLKLIVAPSYDGQIDLERLASLIGGGVTRWSEVLQGRRAQTIRAVIVDTFGDLPRLYGLASVAFVGSLSHGGTGLGHNIVEPLVHGVPTLVGPYVDRWEHLVNQLKRVWEGVQCRDRQGLANSLSTLLHAPELSHQLSLLALELVRDQSAMVRTTREFLKRTLGSLARRTVTPSDASRTPAR